MSPNEQAVRAYVEAFNRGDWEAMSGIFTDDATIRGVLGHAPLERALAVWKSLHEDLSCHLEIAAIAVDEDQVAVRYRETGRFVGPFVGYPGLEPTGQSYELIAMEWFACRGGRIAARWGARDSDSLYKQITS